MVVESKRQRRVRRMANTMGDERCKRLGKGQGRSLGREKHEAARKSAMARSWHCGEARRVVNRLE